MCLYQILAIQTVWEGCAFTVYDVSTTRVCYKEIAELIGKPKACRAVGMANHNNPIAIIVPCHRVVGHNGALTGYAGGLSVKKHLLDLEKPHASTP